MWNSSTWYVVLLRAWGSCFTPVGLSRMQSQTLKQKLQSMLKLGSPGHAQRKFLKKLDAHFAVSRKLDCKIIASYIVAKL